MGLNIASTGAHGVVTAPLSTDNVTDDTPSLAQCNTAFGTAPLAGAGFIGVIDDAGGGLKLSLVTSDGTNWWYVAMVKAS